VGFGKTGSPRPKEETTAICASYVVGVVDGLDGSYQEWTSGSVYQIVVREYDLAGLLDDCMLWPGDPQADAAHLIVS
jgi:hypothetical protein